MYMNINYKETRVDGKARPEHIVGEKAPQHLACPNNKHIAPVIRHKEVDHRMGTYLSS